MVNKDSLWKSLSCNLLHFYLKLHKNWSFPLRISSVNVTKCAVSCTVYSNLQKKFLMENFIFCAGLCIFLCIFILRSSMFYILCLFLAFHVTLSHEWEQSFVDVFQNDVRKNFTNFTGKHLCLNLFLIKLRAWRPATLLKKRLQHKYFPGEICEIFKNTYFT